MRPQERARGARAVPLEVARECLVEATAELVKRDGAAGAEAVEHVAHDGRIMLEIWPVISSVSGTQNFTFEGIEYEVPNIALNELSTEVITESGKPIQLGGFIRRSVAKSLQDLPWKDSVTQTVINPLFRSESNELKRRELVLTVTPTIVEGV